MPFLVGTVLLKSFHPYHLNSLATRRIDAMTTMAPQQAFPYLTLPNGFGHLQLDNNDSKVPFGAEERLSRVRAQDHAVKDEGHQSRDTILQKTASLSVTPESDVVAGIDPQMIVIAPTNAVHLDDVADGASDADDGEERVQAGPRLNAEAGDASVKTKAMAMEAKWRLLTPERIGLFNGDPSTLHTWLAQAEAVLYLDGTPTNPGNGLAADATYTATFIQLVPFCFTDVARMWWINICHAKPFKMWHECKQRLLQDFGETIDKRERRFHARRWRQGEEDIGAFFVHKMSLCRAAYGGVSGDVEQINASIDAIHAKVCNEIRHQAKLDIGWRFEEPSMQYGPMWYLRQIEHQYETKRKR